MSYKHSFLLYYLWIQNTVSDMQRGRTSPILQLKWTVRMKRSVRKKVIILVMMILLDMQTLNEPNWAWFFDFKTSLIAAAMKTYNMSTPLIVTSCTMMFYLLVEP